MLEIVEKVADTESTVLITGASGTGKELIARALHYNSRRAPANHARHGQLRRDPRGVCSSRSCSAT